MAKEIERKYLVKGEYKTKSHRKFKIRQGYLSTDPERAIRVRISDETACLTIKGKTSGITRYEWEIDIPVHEAEELLGLCIEEIIEKTRYLVNHDKYTFEVDEFHGRNKGLAIAELELISDKEIPALPGWIGKEVSHDFRYQNVNLSIHPFDEWN